MTRMHYLKNMPGCRILISDNNQFDGLEKRLYRRNAKDICQLVLRGDSLLDLWRIHYGKVCNRNLRIE